MQTNQLESALRALDSRTQQHYQTVTRNQEMIGQLRSQAASLCSQANAMLSAASSGSDDDDGPDYSMISQGQALMCQADLLESQADALESEMEQARSALSQCRSEYQQYLCEGQNNLRNLQATASTLSRASGSYGGGKVAVALDAVRQRMQYNQKLVDGCQSRIDRISSIC